MIKACSDSARSDNDACSVLKLTNIFDEGKELKSLLKNALGNNSRQFVYTSGVC